MQAAFLEPALQGTLNVLESCAKAKPKRIVLTSSIVAVLFTPRNAPGAVIDESFYTNPDVARKILSVIRLPEPFSERNWQ
jgi:nucleoside-diphosphate-sugar epimerase